MEDQQFANEERGKRSDVTQFKTPVSRQKMVKFPMNTEPVNKTKTGTRKRSNKPILTFQ